MAALRVGGYGAFNCRDRTIQAHRASWRIYKGPIPAGMLVRHKCDERLCVNPNHLEIGTHEDNMRDMVERGRQTSGEKNARSRLTEAGVRAIHADERPYTEIAEDYGVAIATVSNIKTGFSWRYLGLAPKERVARTKREAHGMSRLTEEQVRYILASPLSGKKLASELGVCHSAVCRVRQGKTWRS